LDRDGEAQWMRRHDDQTVTFNGIPKLLPMWRFPVDSPR
jgi:hypothetical protein